MPFKSEAQRRLFYAKEKRGELPKGTAKKWEKHTPKGKKLPEKVSESKTRQLISRFGTNVAFGKGFLKGGS